MLYYETVDTKTLELLKALLSIGIFSELRLVGGTSLALQFGHRKSIDIDLFVKIEADAYEISEAIAALGEVQKLNDSKNIHIWLINGIKVDIVNYPYPWIGELINEDNIRMADFKDIAAMKLAAVAGRGTKKDIYDICLLLNHLRLEEMLDLYLLKYKDGSLFMVLKSLIYFEDADNDAMPFLLKPMKWDLAKQKILTAYHDYINTVN